MGDGLHASINALDSAFLFDVERRLLARGAARQGHRGRPRPVRDHRLRAGSPGWWVPERGRQRAHRHSRVERRPDSRRPPRRREPEAVLARMAPLLHAPARRQRDLGDRPRRVAAHRTFAHRVTPRPGHLPGPHPFAFRLSAQLYSSRGDQSLPRPSGVRSSMAHSGHMKSTCRGCWPSSVGALSSSLLQK